MKKIFFSFVVISILTLLVTTCRMPLGMGPPIDFEAPVLTIDPGPNPRYVNSDTVISGTAVDNVGVVRVTAYDSDGRHFGDAVITGERWSMTLLVTAEDNSQRFILTFTAFDAAGNSDEFSSQTLTIIVDINPPIFDNAILWRSDVRFTQLESLQDLLDLEDTDPYATNILNVNRFQNGAFWIRAAITDNETIIDGNSTRLTIYDAYHDNEDDYIISIAPTPGRGTIFNPEWLITEQM
jgi:hypothetical protein